MYGFVGNDVINNCDILGMLLRIVSSMSDSDPAIIAGAFDLSKGIEDIEKFLTEFDKISGDRFALLVKSGEVIFAGQLFTKDKKTFREQVVREKDSKFENIIDALAAMKKVEENTKDLTQEYDQNLLVAHGLFDADYVKKTWQPSGRIRFGNMEVPTRQVHIAVDSIKGKVTWVSCFKTGRQKEFLTIEQAKGWIGYSREKLASGETRIIDCEKIVFSPFKASTYLQDYNPFHR